MVARTSGILYIQNLNLTGWALCQSLSLQAIWAADKMEQAQQTMAHAAKIEH